jgi:branched-chain amino acid transport system permease protein
VPYAAAVAAGLVAAVLLGLIVERLVVRPLFQASRVTLLVATVGVALFIVGAVFVVGKPEARVLPPAVGGGSVNILGTAIEPQQILALVILGALAVALWLFFSRTNLGLAVLATSQDPLATRIVGISLPGMSRFIWGFAALLGGPDHGSWRIAPSNPEVKTRRRIARIAVHFQSDFPLNECIAFSDRFFFVWLLSVPTR